MKSDEALDRSRARGGFPLAILVWSWMVFLVASTSALAQAESEAEEPGSSILQVRSGVDRSVVDSQSTIHWFLTFTNRSDEMLSGLKVVETALVGLRRAEAAGASGPTSAKWYGTAKVEIAGEDLDAVVTLPAGEAATARIELRAAGEEGRFTPAALYEWKDPAGARTQGFVSGDSVEVKVDSSYDPELVKTLIWPAIALLLGWRFNVAIAKRSQEAQAEQMKRQGLHQQALQTQAEKQQSLRLMLPKLHANAEEYYMPICSKILRLDRTWSKLERRLAPGLSDDQIETDVYFVLAFSDFWILLALVHRMTAKIGGWYLKTRQGEDRVWDCWDPLRREVEARFDRLRHERMLFAIAEEKEAMQLLHRFEPQLLGGDDGTSPPSPASSRRKTARSKGQKGQVDGAPAGALQFDEQLRQEWNQIKSGPFLAWVKSDFGSYVNLMMLMLDVLHFEMNQPYKEWYGSPENFPKLEFKEKCDKLVAWKETLDPASDKVGELEELHTTLQSYADEAARCEEAPKTNESPK
jgi:hypothetical protein